MWSFFMSVLNLLSRIILNRFLLIMLNVFILVFLIIRDKVCYCFRWVVVDRLRIIDKLFMIFFVVVRLLLFDVFLFIDNRSFINLKY